MRKQNGNTFVTTLVVIVVGVLIFLFVIGLRWLSSATMSDRVVTPRPGIECFVVSASDSVGVDCFPTAGLPESKP
ncbi:hypothetical protein D3C85_1578220 [compost metagenome]